MSFNKIIVNESNSTRRRIPFYLVDATDGFTPETGITFISGDIKISKNGTTPESNHTGTVTEVGGGLYYYQFAAGEIDTIGYITIRFTKSGVRTNVTYVEINPVGELLSTYNSKFGPAINIDTLYGTAGSTVGIHGTLNNPVDNLADAVILATTLNIRRYFILGNITLTSIHQDWEFYGNAGSSTVDIGNQNVWGSYFNNLTITGTFDTTGNEGFDIHADFCIVGACSNITGALHDCRIHSTLSLPTSIVAFGYGGGLQLTNAVNSNTYSFPTRIDCGGASAPSLVRVTGFVGELEIRSSAHASTEVEVDAYAGRVKLVSSNTAGTIYYRGGAQLVDQSNGASLNIDGHYGEIADDVLGLASRHGSGKWDNTSDDSHNSLIAYSANPGQTVILAAQILNSNGERTDGYAPTVDSIISPSGLELSGFPTSMTNESTGLYSYGFSVPSGITAIGTYLATISWTHPNTGFTQSQLTVINVFLPFGTASATPG